MHTKEPWKIVEASRTDILIDSDGHTVALITTDGDSDLTDEDEANARLIAAAPDLLAAAEEAFAALVGAHAADDSVQGKARIRLRSAIEKSRK